MQFYIAVTTTHKINWKFIFGNILCLYPYIIKINKIERRVNTIIIGILCKIVHGKRIAGHDEYVHQNREIEKE